MEMTVVHRTERCGVVVLGPLGFHALTAEGEEVGFSHSKHMAMVALQDHEAGLVPMSSGWVAIAPGLD